MLRQLQELEPDACCIDRGTRVQVGVDEAQRNVVADYLRSIRRAGSTELELGFGEILSDFLSAALDGAAPDPGSYDEG
jgi:hypothetical protein